MSEKLNRRHFLEKAGLAVLSTTGFGLASCRSLDKSIIESNHSNETVAIIGGGIGGIAAAYYLKQQKRPFVMFEASHRLGGRIFTSESFEWGAYEFSERDEELKKLVKAVGVNTLKLDQDTWTVKGGSSQFVQALVRRSADLLSHREIQRDRELLSIDRGADSMELNFRSSKNTFHSYEFSHVLLAMPMNRVLKVSGLQDFESELNGLESARASLKVQSCIRWNKPSVSGRTSRAAQNAVLTTEFPNELVVRARYQSDRTVLTLTAPGNYPSLDVASLEKLVSKNFLVLSKSDVQQIPSQIMDWKNVKYVDSGFANFDFQTTQKWGWFGPETSIQILSDSLSRLEPRVESVIQQSKRATELLALYG